MSLGPLKVLFAGVSVWHAAKAERVYAALDAHRLDIEEASRISS